MTRILNRVHRRTQTAIRRGGIQLGESLKIGNRFERWCRKMGRKVPPDAIITALNLGREEGGAVVCAYTHTDPEIYRNYITFIAGKGKK